VREEAFLCNIRANSKRPTHRLTAIPVRYAADGIFVGSRELAAVPADKKIKKLKKRGVNESFLTVWRC